MGPIRRATKLAAQRQSSNVALLRRRFRKGMEVEVCSDDDGFRGAWYEAVVVRLVRKRHFYEVAFGSLLDDQDPSKPLHEVVHRNKVRPRPPPPPSADAVPAHSVKYKLHDLVEAFHNDGWWSGVVSGILLQPAVDRYMVCFPTSREEIEFEPSVMRPQLHWVRGRWVTAQEQNAGEPPFSAGDLVEVSREMEKYGLAWFAATVVKAISMTTFEIEYENLKADEDSDELLTDLVDVQYMRPLLPSVSETKDFSLNDEVEVFHNHGWSPAVLSEVLCDSMYIVKLKHSDMDMEFASSEMRHLRSWDGVQWVHKHQMTEKSLASGRSKSSRSRQSKHKGKRYNLPISVSTTSDDGEDVCTPHPSTLSLKCKTPDGSSPEVQIESSKSKKVKLLDDNLVPENSLELEQDSIPVRTEIECCAAMPTEEDSSSSMDKQHWSASPSLQWITIIPNSEIQSSPNHSSSKLHDTQQTCAVSSIPELLINQEFSISHVEDPKHHSLSDGVNNTPVNREAFNFNSLVQWSNYKGARSPGINVRGGRKKLAARPTQRLKMTLQNADEGLRAQDEIFAGKKDWTLEKQIGGMLDCMQCDVIESRYGGQQDGLSIQDYLNTDVSSMNGSNEQVENLQDVYLTPCLNSSLGSRPQSIKCLTAISLSDVIPCSLTSGFQEVSAFPSRISSENLTSPQENNCALHEISALAISPSKVAVDNEKALVDPSPSSSSLRKLSLTFSKNSSMWEPVESMEVFQLLPQQPHFNALEQYSVEFREGIAIGLMISFANLVSSMKNLQIGKAQTTIEEKLRALAPLEANGFNVEPVRSRLQKLLEMEVYRKQCENKKAAKEANILKRRGDNIRIDAVTMSLNETIKKLEENLALLIEERDSMHKQRESIETEISNLQRVVQEVEESSNSVEQQFSITLTAPW